jgi:N-acetylneuraminate synthase
MLYVKNCVHIIAEAGVNHNGSLTMAKELIDIAVSAGADTVKFQTFKTELVMSRHAPKAEYQKQTTDATESQFDMVKKLELDVAAHQELIDHCHRRGIQFLSTPFDLESIDLLAVRFNLPRIKIPSGEITNAPFLLKVARTQKPIIMSTGMSTLGDVEEALGVIAYGYLNSDAPPTLTAFRSAFRSDQGQKALQDNMVLLHCTTEYPASFTDVNLRAMETLRIAFGLPVGLSDHTPGIAIPIAAAAMGATIIEKHFTLDHNLPGPDHKASLEPNELIEMITSIRQVENALGSNIKAPAEGELPTISIARKSLVASRRIKKGETFTVDNISVKRPGTGISPMLYWEWIGKTALRDYDDDDIL